MTRERTWEDALIEQSEPAPDAEEESNMKTKQPNDFQSKLDKVKDYCAECQQFDILASGTKDRITKIVSELAEECIGEDENLYEKERKTGKFDWRVERETGSNEAKAEIRQRFKEKLKYARNKQQAS